MRAETYRRLMSELNLPTDPTGSLRNASQLTEVSQTYDPSLAPDTVSASVAEVLSTLAEKLETANQRIAALENPKTASFEAVNCSTGLTRLPHTEFTLTQSTDVVNTIGGEPGNRTLSLAERTACGADSGTSQTDSPPPSSISDLRARVSQLEELTSLLAGGFTLSGSYMNSELSVPPAAELTLTGSNDELRMTNDELAAAFNIQHSTFNILSPATIGGNLTVGFLTIDDLNASINSMGETLKLQSLGMGNIELMAGKITIDTSGNIKTVGEITAEKVNVDTSQPATASAESAIIPARETEIEVITTALTPESLIFVTPEGEPVAVATEKSGTGKFLIKISVPLTLDLKVSWWIVN